MDLKRKKWPRHVAEVSLAQALEAEDRAFERMHPKSVRCAEQNGEMRAGKVSVQNIRAGFDRVSRNGEFIVVGGNKMCPSRR
jgi:hypothetical protein